MEWGSHPRGVATAGAWIEPWALRCAEGFHYDLVSPRTHDLAGTGSRRTERRDEG